MESKNEIRKQLILFFVIIIIITSGIFIWMFNGAKDNVGAVLVMMWTPGISAILTSIILKNKIRNFGWKPGKIRFLGYAYLFSPCCFTLHQGNAAYFVSETGILTGIVCLLFSLAFLKILNLNCK